MSTQPAIEMPRDLQIVGYVTIVFGVMSALEMVLRLFNGNLHLDFGILQIPIGLGLLRLEPSCRRWALVFLSLAFVLSLAFTGATILGAQPDLVVFGEWIGTAPKPLALALAITSGLLTVWEFKVLNREEVRRLFEP
jgi:hypothetical protein